MNLRLMIAVVRRSWLLILALPVIVAVASSAVVFSRAPQYKTGTRLLISRGIAPDDSTAGLSATGEDSTAQDLATIISGATFKHDLTLLLAQQGHPIPETTVGPSLFALSQQRTVVLEVTVTQPDQAVPIAQAATELLQRNGLRYWGETRVNDKQPGINVGVLDPPTPVVRLDTTAGMLREVALRTLLGLLAGIGLAFARSGGAARLAAYRSPADQAFANR